MIEVNFSIPYWLCGLYVVAVFFLLRSIYYQAKETAFIEGIVLAQKSDNHRNWTRAQVNELRRQTYGRRKVKNTLQGPGFP